MIKEVSFMGMDFRGKLPIPQDIKKQYPISEAALKIKKEREFK